ncbi:MAG: hypothetical protein MSC31_17620 [Solirubrobacteraceae bacterium MAG38_C4-C5]|nr:hypothetical protein [Candidatus Siliceabacter maunaloa]
MTLEHTPRRVATLVVVGAALLAGTGCNAINELTGTARQQPTGPVVTLIADPSGSTKRWRPQFQQDARAVLEATAESNGTLWALAASGNTLGEAGWQIRDVEFTATGAGGNETLARAARVEEARREVAPTLQTLVGRDTTGGSDLLGGLAQARGVLCDAAPDRERVLVMLSDGAIRIEDGVDLYARPPLSDRARTRLIARLRDSGEIPDLSCGDERVRVYLGGIGRVSNRQTAKAVLDLWRDIIAATGAELVTMGSRLRLAGFPGP